MAEPPLSMDFSTLMLASAHALAALLCVMAALDADERDAPGTTDPVVWRAFAGVLLLLLANTLIRADLWLVGSLRELAREEAWYGFRRPLQFAVLLLLAFLCRRFVQGVGRSFARLRSQRSARLALTGATLLLSLLGLRVVSFHYTDELIQLRLAGISLGRWLDLLGLALLMLAALRRLRDATPSALNKHV